MKKRCKECSATKEVWHFHRSPETKDGLVSKCKDCVSYYQKAKKLKEKRKSPTSSDLDASWMTGVDEVSLGGIWN